MNNPEANFMSPLRTQPIKKQRGGSTPTSKTSSSRTAAFNSSSSSSRPPVATDSSSGPPRDLQASADDAIARRRAELRRLAGQRHTNANPSAKAPPPMPAKAPVTHARASDIFPTVDKPSHPPRSTPSNIMTSSAATTATATSAPPNTKPAPPTTQATTINAPPSPSLSSRAALSTGPTTRAPPRPPASPNVQVPPSAKVARRLDASFAAREARAKSAPPSRPPPPKGGPPPTKKATATGATATAGPPPITTSTSASTRTQSSSRPTPMSPSSLMFSPAPNDKKNKPTTGTTTEASQTTPALKQTSDAVKTPATATFLKKTSDAVKTPATATFLKHKAQAVVQTPVPTTTTTMEDGDAPPSTGRRDMIRNLRASADTPPSLKRVSQDTDTATVTTESQPPHIPLLISETTNRLEEDLKKTVKDKNKALELIANLEQQLSDAQSMQAQNNTSNASSTNSHELLSEFLHLRSTSGEEQALQWAQQHLEGHGHGNEAQVGFMSPMSSAIPTTPMAGNAGTPRRKVRMATPHPKRSFGGDNDENHMDESNQDAALSLMEIERKYHDYFIEAAHNIPYEYSTELATFTVRRPYGLATHFPIFSECSLVDPDQYARRAHISSVASLELAVTIHADGTKMLLHDTAGVRYKTLTFGVWKEYPNVDELDRPLGNISYIDTHANEKDYSLDQVLEEALLTRELYGSSMMNAALAFKDRQPNIDKALQAAAAEAEAAMKANAPPRQESSPTPPAKKQVTEMCVGTEDMPFPPESISVPDKEKKDATAVAVKKPPAPEELPGGSGILTTVIGGFFGLVLSFFWSLFVKTPIHVVRMTLTLLMAYVMVSLVLLFAAEEHASVGGNPYYHYNRPGVY